ncbi:hypothetical protein LZ30DRAFT_543696, partial [Colletotrichum cereale]
SAAQDSSVWPCIISLELTSTLPVLRSILTTALWPLSAARDSGVWLLLALELTSTLSVSRSISTIDSCPFLAARDSG